MHELGIARELLRLVVDSARRHGAVRVLNIRVRVGELAQVVPDSLTFALEIISRGTPAEGAKLDIVEVPLRFVCRSCGQGDADPIAACPACGGEIERRGAREIILESIETADSESEVPHG